MNRQFSMATRAFLFAFIPVGLTLVASFVIINKAVEAQIKDRLRDSIEKSAAARSNQASAYRVRNLKVLSALSENPALKAAIGLSREAGGSDSKAEVKATLTFLLQQMGTQLEYELLLLQNANGRFLAGVAGENRQAMDSDPAAVEVLGPSLMKASNTLYETVSIPVNLADENLGSLILGRAFDIHAWSDFGPAALMLDGEILASTFPANSAQDAEREWWQHCGPTSQDCEVTLSGESFLSLTTRREDFGERVRLVSFQSIDAATSEFTRSVKDVFPIIGGSAVLVAFLFSFFASRAIAKPLVKLVAELKEGEKEGTFPAELPVVYRASEVNLLAMQFSKAAGAVRESEKRLDEATIEFIASMTHALDARDPNTAGHSQRVSVNSAAVAMAMGLSKDEVEIVRIGAHLHDIGKIGIPDSVLTKPGRLTAAEYELIKQHPRIGKEILEKTKQFEPYLSIVELHHENMDGSGYPYGLKADSIPMGVRIVHVVDVHDAITSDRVYRSAMTEEQVWDLLWGAAGKMFDRRVVEIYWEILQGRQVQRDSA